MVGLGRLELPTSRLSGVRSNQAELQALNLTVRLHNIRNSASACPAERPVPQIYMLNHASNHMFTAPGRAPCTSLSVQGERLPVGALCIGELAVPIGRDAKTATRR